MISVGLQHQIWSILPDLTEETKTQTQFILTPAVNLRDGNRVHRGRPCAEGPERGSGFVREVSGSMEGASVEPSDPLGETLEAQILFKKEKESAGVHRFACISMINGGLGIVQCIIKHNKKDF